MPRNNTLQLQRSQARRLLWRDSRESGNALTWSTGFLHVNRKPLLHHGQQRHGPGLRFSFNSRKAIVAEGGANGAVTTVPIKNESSSYSNWKRFAWAVKMARLPFLIGAIYGLGYQQGTMETVRNPLKMQQDFFESVCMEMGVRDWKQVDVISERQFQAQPRGWLKGLGSTSYTETEEKHDPRAEKVALIGREIIRVARQYVKEELNKAVEGVKELHKNKDKLTEVELHNIIMADVTVKQWAEAQVRIEGEAWNGIQNWQYVLVDTPIPNAFVSELLPQRFFVTTGLFKEFVRNDDELAMILGHEISHLIYGHLSENNQKALWFRGFELLILALDPTEGMLSLGIAGFLAQMRNSMLAAFSREHESDADELGCQLAARACFDTKKGSQVFLRMHEYDVEHGQEIRGIMSSHPSSIERYAQLMKQSEDENPAKHSSCHRLQHHVARALTLAPR